MSATNRGGRRSEADFYPTPGWCVERLLEVLELPGGRWLEPAAGDGAIIRAARREDVQWTAWELRDEMQATLRSVLPSEGIHIGDFVAAHGRGKIHAHYAVAITNPPFRLAQAFIDACLARADVVVMLLRLNYLASKARWKFMAANTPDVYVLPTRPSFVGKKTDSTEYAWFVWPSSGRREGRLRILGLR